MARPKERSNALLKELTEELQCAICNDQLRQPKYLQCLHTFCEECLINLAGSSRNRNQKTLTCPLCREKTRTPQEGIAGLKTNFMALSLLEKIAAQEQSKGDYKDGNDGDDDVNKMKRESLSRRKCKGNRDANVKMKQTLTQIAEEARKKLRACQVKKDKNKQTKEKLLHQVQKSSSDLQTTTAQTVSKIIENSEKVSNTLKKVKSIREGVLGKNEQKIETREKRIVMALANAENLLADLEFKIVKNADDVIGTLETILAEEDPEDVDSSLGFLELSTRGLSAVAGILESTDVGDVYDNVRWTFYARSKDKLMFEAARGVDIFADGEIVVADSKSDGLGVVVIEWGDVEKYLTVDETGRPSCDEDDDEDEIDVTDIGAGDGRDVAILSGGNVAVASDNDEVNVYNADDGNYLYCIAPPRKSSAIWCVAVDQNTALFIGNGATNEVSRHEKKQRPVIIKTNNKPWFLAANSNTRQICVSNWRASCVEVIGYEGQALFNITTRGPENPLRPNGVCFHGNDTIYIVHKDVKKGKGEVHRYSAADGSHVGVAVTGLSNPHGICIGSNGKMIVADWQEIKIFQRKPVIFD